MNGSNEINWPESVWTEINTDVRREAAKVRIAQKVFLATTFDTSPTTIDNEVIQFPDHNIKESQSKPFVEISLEFPLTKTQFDNESTKHICNKLSRIAAKSIALAEDMILFQGQNVVNLPTWPGNIIINSTEFADLPYSAKRGLLGEANPKDASDINPYKVTKPIKVKLARSTSRPDLLYGENTFSAVAEGIVRLVSKSQSQPYALFLPTMAYADTFVPPSTQSLVTTAERIIPLVERERGFYGTGTLPLNKGLLVATGGEPTSLYQGREATVEFNKRDGQNYIFRVFERIQFVARDPRAFVLLDFEIEIKKHAHGSIVAHLHSILEKHGKHIASKEKHDELFDNTTETAVKEFQKTKGITDTGIVDGKTYDELINF